ISGLLPLPLLFVSVADAAEYLVRFKESANLASSVSTSSTGFPHPASHSRIESTHRHQRNSKPKSSWIGKASLHSKQKEEESNGSAPRFDYNSNELELTVLSPAKAANMVPHPHNKSKARVEAITTFEQDGATSAATKKPERIQIKSKGRWFTFDDAAFHVWHGDFSEIEAELLANDEGVDVIEKDDIVIQIADESLEQAAAHYQLLQPRGEGSKRPPYEPFFNQDAGQHLGDNGGDDGKKEMVRRDLNAAYDEIEQQLEQELRAHRPSKIHRASNDEDEDSDDDEDSDRVYIPKHGNHDSKNKGKHDGKDKSKDKSKDK
ncbi:hypothetical protein BGW38_009244, partial [Lunasporangiospora selenospora]